MRTRPGFGSYQPGPAPALDHRRDGNCSCGRRAFASIKEKTMTTAIETPKARTVDMTAGMAMKIYGTKCALVD